MTDIRERLYRCDVCGAGFDWSRDASWFGSIQDYDDHGTDGVLLVCSAACKREVGRAGDPKTAKATIVLRDWFRERWPTSRPYRA